MSGRFRICLAGFTTIALLHSTPDAAAAPPRYEAIRIPTVGFGGATAINDDGLVLLQTGFPVPTIWDSKTDSLYPAVAGFDSLDYIWAEGWNNAGQMYGVVRIEPDDDGFGFFWDGAAFHELVADAEAPIDYHSPAFAGLNDLGEVYGSTGRYSNITPLLTRATVWPPGGGPSYLDPIVPYPDETASRVTGGNALGDLVGTMERVFVGEDRPTPRAVLWRGSGTPEDLGAPVNSADGKTWAWDVNDSLWVVGAAVLDVGGTIEGHAQLWKDGTWIDLHDDAVFNPAGNLHDSDAVAVNNAGYVGGHFMNAFGPTYAAFLWYEGTTYVLDDLVVNADEFPPDGVFGPHIVSVLDINEAGDMLVSAYSGFYVLRFQEGPVDPPAEFVVNSTGNDGDANLADGICDTGNLVHGVPECTLEAAITQANARAGIEDITFSIPADDPGHNNGIYTILPVDQLSIISTTMRVDATTQPGYPGSPIVFLDGTVSRGDIKHPIEKEGFRIASDESEVRGFSVGNWGKEGIIVTGNRNKVSACYLGLHPDGVTGAGNITEGIWINNAEGNVVGGPLASDRCVISNNGRGTAGTTGNQLEISGAGAIANRVEGCYVGTNAAGTAALQNPPVGLELHGGCSANVIGGSVVGTRNVISGHGTGVSLNQCSDNLIQGNFIGLNAAGTAALPNQGNGIDVRLSPRTTIGGITNTAGAPPGNVISGNRKAGKSAQGIYIAFDSHGTKIQGNLIGTVAGGLAGLGNGGYGVYVDDPDSTIVGGPADGARNVIAANDDGGMLFNDAAATTVQGNLVGLNALGNAALPNGGAGVELRNCPGSLVGGVTGTIGTPPGNVISGNRKALTFASGIVLTARSNGATVQGNFIGTDATGLFGLGNGGDGVFVENSDSVTVGGPADGARNVIAANDFNGITLDRSMFSAVAGNLIGLNHWGNEALPNGGSGVELQGSPDNVIGGLAEIAGSPPGNVISGNRHPDAAVHGVLADGLSHRNTIQGNFIGLDESGTTDFGNGGHGVFLDGPDSTLVGALDERGRNVISGNDSSGVYIRGGTGTRLYENLIGTDAAKTTEFENGRDGVTVESSSGNEFYENLIRGNHRNGFRVRSGEHNRLERNTFVANEGLGIDLEPGGVTVNDLGDTDEGANALQNFPYLIWAQEIADSNLVRVIGSLSGSPGTDYRVDFFANTACDPSGHGEGEELWVMDVTVRTNVQGFAEFEVPLTLALIGTRPDYVAATATDAAGNSSEFSNCLRVLPPPIPPSGQAAPFVVNSTGDLPDTDPGDNVCSTGETIGGGRLECTLRAAIEETNALVGAQTVLFQIPGLTNPTIVPQTPFPTISGPLELNAQTQPGFNGSPVVTLDGSAAGTTPGLVLNGTGVGVRGLAIEGFAGDGVRLEGSGLHSLEGNRIGAVSGAGPAMTEALDGRRGPHSTRSATGGNTGHGVLIASDGNRVGNVGQMQGNVIAGNDGDGIRVAAGEGNAMLNNGLSHNGGLGINLAGGSEDAYGVTTNDATDGDAGANRLQNRPHLSSARIVGTALLVEGSLESTPNADFEVAFYAADTCDPSGSGEGETYLGSVEVATNGIGLAEFSAQLGLEQSASTVADLEGAFVTATATDDADNTSEFGPCSGSVVPVVLVLFEAVAVDGAVRVSWIVSDESDHAGFHLYRRPRGGEWIRVNETLLTGGPVFAFMDHAARRDGGHEYLLEGLSRMGTWERFGPIGVRGARPAATTLRMVGNPVQGTGSVLLGLPEPTTLALKVFDVRGRLVRVLAEGPFPAGEHEIAWDGRDAADRRVSAGHYWIQLRAPGMTRTTRVTLLR